MSNEKQETIDDIVAEMRTKAECAKPYDDGIVIMLTVLADRLEAAAKRERLLSKPPENDNSAPVVSTVDNKPGNAAAMHEALEAARDLLLPQCNGGTAFAKACGETVNKIMDALSAPPRNCDVGTADEQYERFMNMCNSKDAKQCASCSMRGFTPGCSRDRCFANWAQMPYEKGGIK